ncbi:MAG: outer membrane protein transport protein [Gammaproteobacteria bacterium]
MLVNKNKLILAATVSGLFAMPVAQATNGYFAHGYSTKEKGLAGAGVAYSQDALAAATNPAGMAFVGERMDVGLALFSPSDRGFTVTGAPTGASFTNAVPGETYVSENDLFFIPQFAYSWQVDSDSVMGISVYGNGGMNTEYPAAASPGGAGLFGAGDVGVNLEQAFVNLSMAKKGSSNNAIGVSMVLAAQRFSAQGIDGFGGFAADGVGDNVSGNRHSYSKGAGFKLGYQGELLNNLTLGASYQSKIAMTKFGEYSDLFAGAGDFDIPETYTIGLAYDLGSTGKVVFDVQRINYSGVASIANPIQNLLPPTGCMAGDFTQCLGGSNGAGFGWEDMTIMKLGYEITAGGNTYRVGYSKGDMPIPESQMLFNILAPAVMEQHVTFGMTMPMGTDQEFNLAVMIAPNTSVKGPNPFDGGTAVGGSDIELEMEQKEIQVGWAWKY